MHMQGDIVSIIHIWDTHDTGRIPAALVSVSPETGWASERWEWDSQRMDYDNTPWLLAGNNI